MRSTIFRRCSKNMRLTSSSPASASPVVTQKQVPTSVPVDVIPPATEAPHLLESGATATSKPFFQPKAVKAFTTSLFLGVACAGSVYVLLSKAISSQFEEEQDIVDRITKAVTRKEAEEDSPAEVAKQVRAHLIGDFSAPSSYAELQAKLAAANSHTGAEGGRNGVNPTGESPMLHQEAIYRCKSTWNNMITNVQISLETYAVEYRLRREREAVANVQRLVEEKGFDVSSLRRVS